MNVVRKTISLSLVVFILMNSFLSLFIFLFIQNNIRNEVKSIGRKHEKLVRLGFSRSDITLGKIKLRFKKSDEFLLKGNLYDIKRVENSTDSIIYFCHLDKKETELVNNFSRTDKDISNFTKALKFRSQLISSLNLPVIIDEINRHYNKLYYTNYFIDRLYNHISDKKTPPPKLS